MRFVKKLNAMTSRLSVQIVLLILIIIAMMEFISVSVLVANLLKNLNINTNHDVVKLFLIKIAAINVSMLFLFVIIVLLVSRVFKKINSYAFYSCTTGLPNKNYMMNNLLKEIAANGAFAALISLDMDDFKAVNDTLGHLAGDELLKQAGERFEQVLGEGDCVCHIGGDEFLFFVKSVRNKQETEVYAKEIMHQFSQPFFIQNHKVDYVTGSLGIALMPKDGMDFQTLFNCSDDAMYMAKRLGKSNFVFYEKNMNFHLYEDTIRKKEIKHGIRQKEFKVFYQPKFSSNGLFVGGEALARWVKEDGTILPPSAFIEFAEKNGLIVAITDLIVDEVCRDSLSWIQEKKEFTISINITSDHITNKDLIENLIEKISNYGVPTSYIEFEITESMVIEDFQKAVDNITRLKSFGIKVSMDDFGTGYSSLNYLKRLPIDILKIDKSFVDTISRDEKDRVLLENIINIAHGFHLQVIAEGIETAEQLAILKDMGCDMYQGYYFGKPMNKMDFAGMFL